MRAMQHVKQCSSVFLILYEQNHPKTAISAVLFYQNQKCSKSTQNRVHYTISPALYALPRV